MDNSQIYPVLQIIQPNAAGQDIFSIPFYSAESEAVFPAITFVQVQGDKQQPIDNPENWQLGSGEVVKAALQNIRQTALDWRRETESGSQILIADGHHFAAEKVLDRDFLTRAGELLGSAKICLGIPCRGVMLAAADGDREALEVQLGRYLHDFRFTPLSDMIYFVENGRVVDFARVRFRHRAAAGDDDEAAEQTALPEGIDSHVSHIPLINGRYYFTVFVGAGTADKLVQAVLHFALQIFREHSHQRDFLGLVEFQTKSGAPDKTPDLEKRLQDFFERIGSHPTLRRYAHRFGNPLKIAFLHGSDFQSGNLHLKKTFEIKH